MGTRTCIQLAFLHGALCHILWPRAARLLAFDGKSTPNPKVPCNSRWCATNKASVWLGVVMGCWAWGRWFFFAMGFCFIFPNMGWVLISGIFPEFADLFVCRSLRIEIRFFLAKIEIERKMGQKISHSKSFRLTWRYTYICGLQIVSL